MLTKKRTKCLNCKNRAKWRGVCLGCYSLAKRRITLGKATDEQMVKSGWWLSPRKGAGSDRAAALDKALAAASK